MPSPPPARKRSVGESRRLAKGFSEQHAVCVGACDAKATARMAALAAPGEPSPVPSTSGGPSPKRGQLFHLERHRGAAPMFHVERRPRKVPSGLQATVCGAFLSACHVGAARNPARRPPGEERDRMTEGAAPSPAGSWGDSSPPKKRKGGELAWQGERCGTMEA